MDEAAFAGHFPILRTAEGTTKHVALLEVQPK